MKSIFSFYNTFQTILNRFRPKKNFFTWVKPSWSHSPLTVASQTLRHAAGTRPCWWLSELVGASQETKESLINPEFSTFICPPPFLVKTAMSLKKFCTGKNFRNRCFRLKHVLDHLKSFSTKNIFSKNFRFSGHFWPKNSKSKLMLYHIF